MRFQATGIGGTWLALLLTIVTAAGLSAEENQKEMIQGSGYISLRHLMSQVGDTTVMIHEPGVFEGEKTITFGQGNGFSLALGGLQEGERYFGGGEFEWLMHFSEIEQPLTSSYYQHINSLDQMSLNLNGIFGVNVFQRRFRPYVFGGIGYTEVRLIGHYGPAQVDYGDDSYDDTFGYHAGVGATLRLYKNLYLDAGGRYYGTTDPKIGNGTIWIEIPNSGYIAHIGLTYNHLFPPQEKKSWRDAKKSGK